MRIAKIAFTWFSKVFTGNSLGGYSHTKYLILHLFFLITNRIYSSAKVAIISESYRPRSRYTKSVKNPITQRLRLQGYLGWSMFRIDSRNT